MAYSSPPNSPWISRANFKKQPSDTNFCKPNARDSPHAPHADYVTSRTSPPAMPSVAVGGIWLSQPSVSELPTLASKLAYRFVATDQRKFAHKCVDNLTRARCKQIRQASTARPAQIPPPRTEEGMKHGTKHSQPPQALFWSLHGHVEAVLQAIIPRVLAWKPPCSGMRSQLSRKAPSTTHGRGVRRSAWSRVRLNATWGVMHAIRVYQRCSL